MKASEIAIFTDLDGTLFTSNTIKVSKGNVDAINEFVKIGGSFTLATGRNIDIIKQAIHGIDINFPVVLCNGAYIYDLKEDKPLLVRYLSDDALKFAYEVNDKLPFCCMTVVNEEKYHMVRKKGMKMPLENIYNYHEVDRCEVEGKPMIKVVFYVKAENKEALREELNKYNKKDAVFTESSPEIMEIIPINTSKARGIADAVKIAGGENKKIVAIGDYLNDIEMLKSADIAACVSNAHEDLKRIAKIQTRSNDEDAMEDLINKLLAYET